LARAAVDLDVLQLSKHIGKAAWSTADKALYIFIGLAFILPQKVIGERNWGVFTTAQAILNVSFALSDGFALQPIVNFGMETERRSQAFSFSAILHILFIGLVAAMVFFGRGTIAGVYNEPLLVSTLALFPLTALGFLLRNYFLKVSQLHIDPRTTFLMDLVWIGSLIALIVHGWTTGTLVKSEDMMMISALSSGASSLVGLFIYRSRVRLTLAFEMDHVRRMFVFSATQFLSSAMLALQAQGDVLLLKRFASSAMVGNYDTAKKIFRGFEAFRDAGALLIFPGAARLTAQNRDAEMVLMVEKMIGFSLVALVPLVLVVWLGPTDTLFHLIYKGKYLAAPMIFKVLSLAALTFPFTLNVYVLNGAGRAASVFRVTLLSAATFFIAGIVLIPPYGAVGAALAVVIGYASMGVLATHLVRRYVPFNMTSALGRWRDVTDFGTRFWKKRIGK
jgi:O-antigen/teichoic acid export membrane protein